MNSVAETLPLDKPEPVALVPADPASSLVLMFERLAKDKDVDAGKLRELVDLQERILDRNAKAAFNEAFQVMVTDIPEIDEKGRIKNRDGNVQSTYSLFEDIQRVIKPILTKHGFALSFRSEWPAKGVVKVIGILTHRDGHTRESEFMSDGDESGSKNNIQGLGSAVSYGRRYTTIDLLNITTRGVDDDGKKAGKQAAPEPPEGFEKWWAALTAAAERGLKTFDPAWECSEGEFKNYAMKFHRDEVNALKKTAAGKR